MLSFINKNLSRRTFRKVPEITLYFWLIKLLTTAMGESTSDYFVHHFDPVVVVILAGVCLTIALLWQLIVSKYVTWIYWLAVVMVAVFGTMAADVVHIVLGVPYLISTIFFATILATNFIIWYKTEHTLSIHSIYIFRREIFYWVAVMATFALGTAAGDMSAITLGLGYLSSALLFMGLIALPAVAYYLFGLNGVVAFWFAYIVTRPLGASLADWVGRAPNLGGIGFGTGKISIILTALIVGLVFYLTVTSKDIKD